MASDTSYSPEMTCSGKLYRFTFNRATIAIEIHIFTCFYKFKVNMREKFI